MIASAHFKRWLERTRLIASALDERWLERTRLIASLLLCQASLNSFRCHAERSEASQAGGRCFAALSMTAGMASSSLAEDYIHPQGYWWRIRLSRLKSGESTFKWSVVCEFATSILKDVDPIERMFFDGVLKPVHGRLRSDLSRTGMGLEFKRQDAERYAV